MKFPSTSTPANTVQELITAMLTIIEKTAAGKTRDRKDTKEEIKGEGTSIHPEG